MASGNRSGYGSWELDKGDSSLDYCDVGLGLRIPWQQQQQQHQQQQHQQQRQQSSVSWLQNCQNHSENSRSPSPSPAISGFSIPSRFGEGGRVSFTAGQRQELERQTMIFKYMMASIPVPHDLLTSLSKYPSSATTTTTPSSVGRKGGVEVRYGGNRGGDAEPWRCRRTDGKKWRCSRDVAPDQKYCERHSHKGRPSRSRKPVESASASLTSSLSSSSTTTSSSLSSSHISPTLPVTTLFTPSVSTCNPIIFTPFSIPKPTSSFDLPSPQFNPLPRYPDWFMKKDVTPSASSSCLFPHHVTDSTSTVDDPQSCLLSRPFIDAWSLGDHLDPKNDSSSHTSNTNNNNCITATNNHSILPLTLSMSAGIDSEDPTKDNPDIRLSSSSSHHHQPLNWMSSWISSPPGGPLAEALCLGISGPATGHSDELVSPHGHSTGSSTTTLG